MTEHKRHHYVPEWYQKRFIPGGNASRELYYLNLKPKFLVDPIGVARPYQALRKLGPKFCFSVDDLYTLKQGLAESKEIETRFFGAIDDRGKRAVDYYDTFDHTSVDGDLHRFLLQYMSAQKLRTPKGLDWLSEAAQTTGKNPLLAAMLEYSDMHCAVWNEAVWQIADASASEVKFIVSDHPITVYNSETYSRSLAHLKDRDPDIRMHGTHTLFPLSLNRILILTNLSWVRNPFRSPIAFRPNPMLFRETVFNFMTIQIRRMLSDQEVLQLNYIIKKRAHRYIAAGKKDWLYPELSLPEAHWKTFAKNYLLMPDPRSVRFTGETILSYGIHGAVAFDPYGRRPGQRDYMDQKQNDDEWISFNRFKDEFARLFGPKKRGLTADDNHYSRKRC